MDEIYLEALSDIITNLKIPEGIETSWKCC